MRESKVGNYVSDRAIIAHPLAALTAEYLHSRKFEPRLNVVERMQAYGGAVAQAIAAHAYVDIVARAKHMRVSEKEKIMETATHCAISAYNRSLVTDNTVSAKVKSSQLLAELPLMRAIYVENRYPTLQEVALTVNSSHSTLSLAQDVLKGQRRQLGIVNTDVIGAMSEIGIKTLYNRYAVQKVRSAGFVAISSLYSQDNARAIHPNATPWDIAVYTTHAAEKKPEPRHKIQVKTTSSDEVPNDRVLLISPQDLSTPGNPCNFTSLATQFDNEMSRGSERATQKLDDWTEVLLSKFEA